MSYKHGNKHSGQQNLREWGKHENPRMKRGAPPDYGQATPHTNAVPTQRPWADDPTVQLTESIDSMFTQSPLPHQVSPNRDLSNYDFIYDVILFTPGGDKIRRRLFVDFRTDVNLMSDSVYRRLHVKASAYDKAQSNRLPGRGDVKPLGTVAVQWSLHGDSRIYHTRFHVVNGCHADLVLGRPSVKEHQLYRKDAAVISRLNASYHS
ncbi:hypothetical protein BJX96DRAFT_48188 [Aspergillus floccosus]